MAMMSDRTANDWEIYNAALKNARGLKPRWQGTFNEQTALIDQEILKLKKTKDYKDFQIENILGPLTDDEKAFLQGTMDPDYAAQVAKYNPELTALQKKYNALVAEKGNIDNYMINLNDAKSSMEWAVSNLKSSANKQADVATAWTALNKAIQVGAAQGTAGRQGATAGQLNKAQNEISNQFASKFSDIEAQRQSWLYTAAQIEAGIPAQMSAIAAQNAQNMYNRALTNQLWWGSAGGKSTKKIPDRRDKYKNGTINLTPAIGVNQNQNNIPDYLEPQFINKPISRSALLS